VTRVLVTTPVRGLAIYVTSALLIPSSVMPRNAKRMLKFRLWFRLRLSTNSCSATLVMMPAVVANMHA
jgi:hypothetical protein